MLPNNVADITLCYLHVNPLMELWDSDVHLNVNVKGFGVISYHI